MNIKNTILSIIFAMTSIAAFSACNQNSTEADTQSNLNDEPSVELSAEVVESAVESVEESTAISSEDESVYVFDPTTLTGGGSHDEEDSEDEESSNTNEYLGFTYEFVDEYHDYNDVIEITKFTGTSKDIVIPNEIDGHSVMIIGEKAFEGNENIQSLVIPENLKWIKESAFSDCKNLSKVTFEGNSTLYELSEDCFYQTNISEITIPETCAIVDRASFLCCYNLKKLTILGMKTHVYNTLSVSDDCVIRCYKDSTTYTELLAAFPVKYNIEFLE